MKLLKRKFQQKNIEIKQCQDVKRFGFVDVHPILNQLSEEQFGVIEIAPDLSPKLDRQFTKHRKTSGTAPTYTAGLRISGTSLNLWLADDKLERDFWQKLAGALPNTPAQFILRRRQGHLRHHLSAWEDTTSAHFADESLQMAFLDEYFEHFILPSEAANPVELWAGVLISGCGEVEVSERLATLYASLCALDCEITPLTAADLSALLVDYYNPCAGEEELERLAAGELPLVEPAIGESAIYSGLAHSFWRVAAPPSPCEGGWVKSLLDHLPRQAEFDLVAHISPAYNDYLPDTSVKSLPAPRKSEEIGSANAMVNVLERRLSNIEAQLNLAESNGEGVLYFDLQAKFQETLARLETLVNGSEQYFEVALTIGLRCETAELENLSTGFLNGAIKAGIALQLVTGANQVDRAWHNCAPLNTARLPRSFVVPSQEAARLVQLAVTNSNSVNENALTATPLLGLNLVGEPVYLGESSNPAASNLFLVGNKGAASVQPAKNMIKYLAAMRYLSGQRLLGFDPQSEWRGLTSQLGGKYVAFGPENTDVWHFNPLQFVNFPSGKDTLEVVENWSAQTTSFLAKILNLHSLPQEQNGETLEQLHNLLVELVFNNCNAGEEADEILTAEKLYNCATNGGYSKLARHLNRCVGEGDLAWLFGRNTKLAPAFNSKENTVLFIGFTQQALTCLSKEARSVILARAFAYFCDIPSNPELGSRVLVLDEASGMLLEGLAALQLNRLYKSLARRKFLDIWCIGDTPEEWLSHQVGQLIIDQSEKVFFFKQSGPSVIGASKRLGLPVRAQRAIRDVPVGGAVFCEKTGNVKRALEVFVPVAHDYLSRLSYIPIRNKHNYNSESPRQTPRVSTSRSVPEPEITPVVVIAPSNPFHTYQFEVSEALENQLLRKGA